jgi:hypothetical protein
MNNNYVSFLGNPERKYNLKKLFQLSKIFSIQSWVICLVFIVVSLPQNTIAQTTLFQFNFENTLNPNIDNVIGIPTFTSNGTDTNNYTTSGNTCQGIRMWLASNWDTGDYHRFTVNTTGYANMNFSFCDRTDVNAIGTFIVRVSSDNGASWTTVLNTFTPVTSNTTRTTDIFPTQANNNTEVWIEIYKTGNTNPNNSRQLFLDAATLTGLAIPTFSPTSGCSNSGQLVTITGSGFTSSSTVSFNGTAAPTTFISETQLTATLPNNATTGPITVTIPGTGTVTSNSNFTINPNPTDVTATASQSTICEGETVSLSSNATSNSNTATTLLSENFNGTPTGWTTTNTSTGGNVNNAAWTLRPNNYNYNGDIYRSNDNSQFYLSNSEAQGSGTTNTTLVSPAFSTIGLNSATLNFWHYYNDNSTDSAYLEISTDGQNWTILQTYDDDLGSRTGFVNVNQSLNAYLNQPNVQIRFRYQATNDRSWAIDNVTVSSTPATPALTYAWTSNPAGYTSSEQNPTGVAPTVTTTYTVRATNNYGCWTEASTTITVMELNSVTAASSTPTICINTALIDITHTTTGATEIGTATGLPNGVVATWDSNTITISGTPTESGTFTYSIPLIGGCGTATATGTIEVTPIINTVSDASSLTSTLCINTVLTDITHTTTGTTGIDTPTGLPAGVTATWNNNVITISGTPTESGTFNYSIPLLGCGNVIATGEIVVLDNSFVSAPSATPSLCVNSVLTDITHTTVLATGIGTPIDLPNGVTASWNNDVITISGTPTASGVYRYTIPVFGCGTADATGIITVEDSVDAAGIISGNNIVCQGETNVIYTVPSIANATNYIWNLPTGATITSGENTNSITVSFSTIAESGIITVQGSNSCGNGTISADFVVTVNKLPSNAGIINGNALICQGQTGVVYTIAPIMDVVTYNWSLPTGATIVSGANTNSITVDFANNALSGNISVYGSNSCGNGLASDTFDVTVDVPSEAPTNISGTATICEGTSTTLTLVGGIQGTNATAEWFTDTCGGTAVGTGNSITVSPIITTTYYVRYNGNCNITDCASTTVNVDPLPIAAGSFNTSSAIVCEGQTNVVYTIPAIDNATNYIWTVPTGFDIVGVLNTNSITVNITSSAVSGDITVYGNNACGDGDSSSVSVTVNPLPIAAGTITGSATVCQGQNGVVYSVPTIDHATTYNWTVPTGASIVSGNGTDTITINFLGNAISGNITVQGQNGCGTGAISANYPITVNIPSVAPTSITGTTTICEGTSTTLTMVGGSAGTGAMIEWFSTSCGGTFVGNGNSIIVSPTTTTTYYVRYSGDCNATACASITVNVDPLPVAAGAISGPNAVCQGEEGVNYFIPAIANATNYVWTFPTGVTINSEANNSIYLDFSYSATSGNITVYGENGCGVGATSTLAVTINVAPLIENNYTSTICSGETASITPTNGGGNIVPASTTYSWGLPDISGGITGATVQSNQASFTQTLINTSGTQQIATYEILASTNGCSSSTFTITVYVDPRPTVALTPNSILPICSGETINITPYNPNMISGSINYSWTRIDGNTNVTGLTNGNDSIEGELYNLTNTAQTVTFSVTATSDSNCGSITPATISIIVNPMPVITAPTNFCSDVSPTLTSTVSGGTWTSSDTDIATISNTGVVTAISSGTVVFSYSLASGCSTSKSVVVYASPTLTAPTTICQGSTATLSPSTGGTWTSSNNSIATITNAGVVTPGNTGTVTFTFTTTDGCSRTTNSIQILAAPPVINSVTSTQNTVCSGNPSILEVDVDGVLSNPITLINFNFNTGNNYGTLDDGNIANIACSVSNNNLGFTAPNNSGTTTNAQAFTQNNTAGRGLQQTDDGQSNDAGYWEFNMTGTAVPNYQNFRIYFQARRTTTFGDNKTIDVQYRRNNAGAWNDLGTVNLNNNSTDWQTGLFPLPAGANNSTSLQFRLNVSDGWTANNNQDRRPHVIIDNFQIQGATLTDNTLYSWTANTGANAGLPANAGIPSNNNDQITVRPQETTTYTAFATNSAGCSSTSNITVNVFPTPEITVAVDYCPVDIVGTPQDESNMVKLVASCSNATITSWLWSTGETGNTIYVDVADAYQVIGTSSNGCPGSASANIAQELVFNGDFTLGNTGFGTDYTYRADVAGNNELVNDDIGPGNPPSYVNGYSITNNANNVHNNFWGRDHTQNPTGAQNFMVVNGHGTEYVVWRQTVTVEANTTYYFSAWGMSLNSAGPFANLQFRVNGQTHGTTLQLTAHAQNDNQSSDNWRRFYGTWETTTGGDILIEIINLENSFGGNDFGIDDISFGTLSTFIRLSSDDSTDEQTVCQNTPITDISYSIGGGLTAPAINWKHNNNDLGTNVFPSGLSYNFNGLNYTISGSPTVPGDYEYVIETGSDCGEPKTASGTLIVHEAPTTTIAPVSVACLSEGYVTVSATFGGSATSGNWSGGTGTFQNVTTTGNTITADYYFGTGETTAVTLNFTANAPMSSVCTNNITPLVIRLNSINPRSITAPTQVCMPIPELTINGLAATVSAAINDAIITYQWESSTTDCDSGFSDITVNGNSQNYTIPAGLAETTYFRRKAISTLNGVPCIAYSNCVTITANNITAGTISADQTICRSGTPQELSFIVPSTIPAGATVTYLWQRKTIGDCSDGGWGNAEGTNNLDTYTPPSLITTTYYRVRIISTLNGLNCTVYSNCIIVTVNPAVSPGGIGSNRYVCYGGNPTAFTGSIVNGGTYQWQSSTDGSNFTDIFGANDPTYDEPGPVYQTTYYRRVTFVTNNGVTCQATTGNVIVFVNHITDAPVIVGSQIACNVAEVTELSILTPAVSTGSSIAYRWQISTTGCSGTFIDIGATAVGNTYTPTVLNTTSYYRVRVISTLSGVQCTDVYSNCIEVTYTGKIWNGSVSTDWYNDNNWTPNGVPDATNCVIIPNVANDPIIEGTNTNAYALNLSILTGGSLEVNSTNNITVTDFVNVNATGLFDIKNNASLIQINDNAVNVGNIKYSRTSRPMTRYAYVYWGSPVEGNVISQIPSQFDLKYRWEPNTGVADGTWLALSTTVPGEGFITRVRNVAPFSTGIGSIPFTFTGKPNNGIINVNVSSFDNSSMVSANTTLLANPYPSTIDAEEFLMHPNNTELGGTLSFWTSVTLYSGTGPYNVQDYASWNLTGGTITSNAPATDPSNDLRPNGKISSGQGFFAQVFADGQITFNNAMRQSGSNSQFYRTGNSTEKHRIWVNLFDQNKFRQTLIGYVSGATNEFDRLYDGDAFTSNEINIYSILDDHALVIQGRALPFDDNDIIPLGYKITTAGTYNIGIDEIDGVFAENQNVYLKDKLLNIIHDIKANNYSFSTASGTFDDRFEIVFRNGSLGIDNPNSTLAQAYVKDQTLYINASKNIEEIILYDVAGKRLKKFKNDIPTTSFKTEFNYPNGIYIAKVKMDDRTIVNVKIGN